MKNITYNSGHVVDVPLDFIRPETRLILVDLIEQGGGDLSLGVRVKITSYGNNALISWLVNGKPVAESFYFGQQLKTENVRELVNYMEQCRADWGVARSQSYRLPKEGSSYIITVLLPDFNDVDGKTQRFIASMESCFGLVFDDGICSKGTPLASDINN